MDLCEPWSKQCDADGQLNIYGIMELAVREMVEGGEVIVRRRPRRPGDGLAVPLQLQIMEGDQLDLAKVSMSGDTASSRASSSISSAGAPHTECSRTIRVRSCREHR
jgi:capsid protein